MCSTNHLSTISWVNMEWSVICFTINISNNIIILRYTINTENPATVVTPGVGYIGGNEGDTVTDNLGNEYTIDVDENGGIKKLTPVGELKFPQITGEVEFEINTQTGFGVILKPRFTTRPVEPQGEVCLLYTSPSPRDRQKSRMPSSA